MADKRVLYAFQDDLKRGMSIEDACRKHQISFKYAFENMPNTVPRKSPRCITRLGRKPKPNSATCPEKYIWCRDGRYTVRKTVNKKTRMFGTYNSLEDAVAIRDYCEKHGWKQRCVDRYCLILGIERSQGNGRGKTRYG